MGEPGEQVGRVLDIRDQNFAWALAPQHCCLVDGFSGVFGEDHISVFVPMHGIPDDFAGILVFVGGDDRLLPRATMDAAVGLEIIGNIADYLQEGDGGGSIVQIYIPNLTLTGHHLVVQGLGVEEIVWVDLLHFPLL